jgi:hypothetical protein
MRNDQLNTGPSVDHAARAKQDLVYSEEPFQLNSHRLPVSLRRRTRPATSAPRMPALNMQRIPILVRNSNSRPIEDGSGDTSSTWRVSDPGWAENGLLPSGALPGVGADADAGTPTDARGISMGTIVGLGLAVGLGVYLLRKGG